jgi:ubiquinone/menaquinone biosynthesis C-methylase UbiE
MKSQNPPSDQDTIAGQAVYSPWVLALYDWWVLGISNQWIWRCPTRHLLDHFNRHITANHLDIGVGTGYFLDHVQFPSTTPRLALLDLNPTCLQVAAKRVARYTPATFQTNILESLNLETPHFDSISLNYILHCLPGTLQTKAIVFDHLNTILNPGGVIFGSTLLHDCDQPHWIADHLMQTYNAKKIFSNDEDHEEELRTLLTQRFSDVSIERKGYAALFSARNPIKSS